jgi:hypothetical protein
VSPDALARRAAALLGSELAQFRRLTGGDLSDCFLIRLADGREAVAKSGPAPRTEAEMLAAIAATGAPAPRRPPSSPSMTRFLSFSASRIKEAARRPSSAAP